MIVMIIPVASQIKTAQLRGGLTGKMQAFPQSRKAVFAMLSLSELARQSNSLFLLAIPEG